ncbi:hypothetical protein D3C81_1744870 [compost metagenome]
MKITNDEANQRRQNDVEDAGQDMGQRGLLHHQIDGHEQAVHDGMGEDGGEKAVTQEHVAEYEPQHGNLHQPGVAGEDGVSGVAQSPDEAGHQHGGEGKPEETF